MRCGWLFRLCVVSERTCMASLAVLFTAHKQKQRRGTDGTALSDDARHRLSVFTDDHGKKVARDDTQVLVFSEPMKAPPTVGEIAEFDRYRRCVVC